MTLPRSPSDHFEMHLDKVPVAVASILSLLVAEAAFLSGHRHPSHYYSSSRLTNLSLAALAGAVAALAGAGLADSCHYQVCFDNHSINRPTHAFHSSFSSGVSGSEATHPPYLTRNGSV